MFDIGFLEIMVILVITLLVIGPERMPEVARKLGSFLGKMRRFVNSVKSEGEVADTINDFKKSIDLEEQKKQMTDISDELNKGLSVGLENVNMDELHRPFNQGKASHEEEGESSFAPSQFNKAPTQPKIPAQTEETEAEISNKSGSEAVAEPKSSPENQSTQNTAASSETSESTSAKETSAKS